MIHNRGVGISRLLAAVLLAGGVVVGSAQSGQLLSALTVPTTALPVGCALTPPPAPSPPPVTQGGVTVIHSTLRSQFPTNPWSGTDRQTVAAIHIAINAERRRPLPDVPLTMSRDAAAEEWKWADNILEAYHAAYTAVGGYQVEVFAVTFNDVKLATTPEPLSAILNPPRGPTSRMVRGATVVRVSAPTPTECFGAVRTYIQSLK